MKKDKEEKMTKEEFVETCNSFMQGLRENKYRMQKGDLVRKWFADPKRREKNAKSKRK